ncbi:MAG: hypothetical protein AAB152_03335 [Candidatus Coatesbacteria bacterium]
MKMRGTERNRRIAVTSMTALMAIVAAFTAGGARANARPFAYGYDSGTLPAGQHEFELWTTWRVGRNDVYSRFDHRIEYEAGVTDTLQTALYLNWSKASARDPLTGSLVSETSFGGISNEWKWKLSDPAADPVGFAAYAELTADTDEAEVELKAIVDKRIGGMILAYNATVEPEFEYDAGEIEAENVNVEHNLGLSVQVSPGFSCGVEVFEHSAYTDGKPRFAALFAGPVLHVASGRFWLTATTLIQLPALKPSVSGQRFVLDEHEKVKARILVSLPL